MARRRLLCRAGVTLAAFDVVAAASWLCCVHVQPPEAPALGGVLRRASIRVGDRERTYAFYAPPSLPDNAPLLFALHGSGGDGEQIREMTGYRFDQLAEREGFVVVYPDGFGHNWDDCRKVASYPARALHIDDVGFIRALIERFRESHHVDPARVFAMGYSNGGQMSYRLALEMPDRVLSVAAVSAGLPTPENEDCSPSGKPVSVLIMNGTVDPINPYAGGRVTFFGSGDRGTVLSSVESARYFAGLAGVTGAPSVERVGAGDASLWLERSTWGSPAAASGVEVVLDTIHGGGHTVPQAVVRYPRIVGPTYAGLDGPAEMWSFFARQRRR
jgi:polyhydroxybutyrate depolymerase